MPHFFLQPGHDSKACRSFRHTATAFQRPPQGAAPSHPLLTCTLCPPACSRWQAAPPSGGCRPGAAAPGRPAAPTVQAAALTARCPPGHCRDHGGRPAVVERGGVQTAAGTVCNGVDGSMRNSSHAAQRGEQRQVGVQRALQPRARQAQLGDGGAGARHAAPSAGVSAWLPIGQRVSCRTACSGREIQQHVGCRGERRCRHTALELLQACGSGERRQGAAAAAG